MLNPFREVNWNPDTAARRTFASSLMIGFPCIAIIFAIGVWIRTGIWHPASALKLGGIGVAAGALFYIFPVIARPFYVAWYALACCVGLVMGNVLLGAIFFVLVTGIGLLKRLGGKQAIQKTFDRAAPTYWLDAPATPNPKRYFSQF